MPQCSASVAVVGAGDYIGAAIARRFAREGYHVFAGRRNGEKLAPLVGGDRGRRRGLHRPDAGRPAGRRGGRFHAPGRRGCAAGGGGVQHRRQREFPAARNHRTGVSESLGTGLLCRVPHRAGGGAVHAAAWAGLDLLHRRDCERARRQWLHRLRQRQVRAARRRAKHGAGAWAAEHPRRASGDRCRGRYRMGAPADRGARRFGGGTDADGPGLDRRDVLAVASAATRCLDA